MGLFGDRMKDPVRGEGYVVSCWDRPEADKGDCRVTLTVRAEGVSSRTVEVSEKNVKRDMWPRSGQTLPITIDREDPEKVKVEWGEVQAVAGPATTVSTTPTPAPAPTTQPADPQEQSAIPGMPTNAQMIQLQGGSGLGDQIKAAMELAQQYQENMPQMYGQGMSASVPPAAPAPAAGGKDKIIADLERLAKLKADGVLTDTEFEAQKKKILGG